MRILLFCFSLLLSLSSQAVIIEMTENELEEKLGKGLPYKLDAEFLKIEVSQPQVTFPKNSERLQVEVNVLVMSPSTFFSGTATLESGISYNADQKAFYLQDPQFTKLDVPTLSYAFRIAGKELLNQLAKDHFTQIKVYQLNNNNPGESMASSMLNSVSIKNQKLLLDVDLF